MSITLDVLTCPDGLEGKFLMFIVFLTLVFVYWLSVKYDVILMEFFASISFVVFSIVVYNCAFTIGLFISIIAVMLTGVSFVRMMVKLFE